MTSDMPTKKHSVAWKNLQYALGEERVRLNDLTPPEFDEILRNILRKADTKEVRGFKELKKHLPDRMEPSHHRYPSNSAPVELSPSTVVEVIDDEKEPDASVGLHSHFIGVSRVLSVDITWRKHESGEETSDWEVADGWGNYAYLYSVHSRAIFLRRPPNHTGAEENLFDIRYVFVKLPAEDRYVITNVLIERVSIPRFREHFGEKYGSVAGQLIHELASAHSRTLSELEVQVNGMRQRKEYFYRMSDALI